MKKLSLVGVFAMAGWCQSLTHPGQVPMVGASPNQLVESVINCSGGACTGVGGATVVSVLPTAAAATLNSLYVWTGGTAANSCPASGAGGSGGSVTVVCVTYDHANWQTVFQSDASGTLKIGTTVTAQKLLSYGNVAAWGDSLTSGTGGTPWPTALTALSGQNTYNGGEGGDTSTQVATRFLADTDHRNWFIVIWAGRNNFTDPTTVQADIASIIAALPSPKQYLVLSVLNSSTSSEWSGGSDYITITGLNSALAATYPANYLDVRAALVAAYDPGQSQDVIDHGHDIPPSSLRSDSVHLNTAGYAFVAQQVQAWMLANADERLVLPVSEIVKLMANGPPIGTIAAAPGSFLNLTLAGGLIDLAGDNNGYQIRKGLYPVPGGTWDLGFAAGTLDWGNGFFEGLVTAQQFQLVNARDYATMNGAVSGDGKLFYCTDCKNVVDDAASPGAACSAGGHGAVAKRQNGHWDCN